ncbi:Cilia/flagella-associated protein 20/WDR90/C3orf67 [Syncephalastrum racemosum]|uniref:Cilia/flagella-associated protein 20/WDR90/C3orf67 n=1 Tax=Syncephalastrum racemosum TaxID=13706 RepID=A0A1X2GZ47_SYNRA|nr:Cilia/flagella-associated protein 20/WDR90/C3orf67 [Syncephalastrum racemosum]
MFKNTFQSGFLSILYSVGTEPLQLWHSEAPEKQDEDESEHIAIVTDDLIQSRVLELQSSNVSDTFITCPASLDRTLGIKLPYIILLAKNMNQYFSFEIQVLDDQNETRRFRASNYQLATRVKPYITTMPMRLDPGWNQIAFDLSDYVQRAYGTHYVETLRVTIHANCRLRRVYFTDRHYAEDELPAEFKLFLPVSLLTLT